MKPQETTFVSADQPDPLLERLRKAFELTEEQLRGAMVVLQLKYLAGEHMGEPLASTKPSADHPCRGGHYKKVAKDLAKKHQIPRLPAPRGPLPEPYLSDWPSVATSELQALSAWHRNPDTRELIGRTIDEIEWHRRAEELAKLPRITNLSVSASAHFAAKGIADHLEVFSALAEAQFDPAAITWLRKDLMLNRVEFARVLGTNSTNVQRWEEGAPPSGQFLKRYQLLADMLGIEGFNPLAPAPKGHTRVPNP